jgi:hypothetical protein
MPDDSPDGDPPLPVVWAVISDVNRLRQHGYHDVAENQKPSEPGQYRVIGQDVAPGWGEYMYELEIYELPEHPLRTLGWAV